MNINSFLMAELKKLKDDQKRLNDELLAVKIQNMNLTSRLDSALQFSSAVPRYVVVLMYRYCFIIILLIKPLKGYILIYSLSSFYKLIIIW